MMSSGGPIGRWAMRHPGKCCATEEQYRSAGAVASQLGITPGALVLYIRRLRLSDGVPLAVLENHLPPGLSDITPEQLEQQGLYAILRNRGVSMRVARQTIGARAATRDEAPLLGIAAGAPVLTMTRVVFDDSGASVETGSHSYVPDLYTFEITLDEPGIGADRCQRARDDPFRLLAPCRCKGLFVRIPFGMLVVPVAHDLINTAAI